MRNVKDTFLQQGFSTKDLVYNSVFYRLENGKLIIIYEVTIQGKNYSFQYDGSISPVEAQKITTTANKINTQTKTTTTKTVSGQSSTSTSNQQNVPSTSIKTTTTTTSTQRPSSSRTTSSQQRTTTTTSSGQSQSNFTPLLTNGSISVNTRTNLVGFNRASRQNAELYPFVMEGMTRVKDTFLKQGFSTEDLIYNSVFYRIENGKLIIIYEVTIQGKNYSFQYDGGISQVSAQKITSAAQNLNAQTIKSTKQVTTTQTSPKQTSTRKTTQGSSSSTTSSRKTGSTSSSSTTKTTTSTGKSRSSFSKLLKDGSISVNTRTNLVGFTRASRENADLYPFVLEGMTRVKDAFLQQGFSTEDLVYNSVFYRLENGKLIIIYEVTIQGKDYSFQYDGGISQVNAQKITSTANNLNSRTVQTTRQVTTGQTLSGKTSTSQQKTTQGSSSSTQRPSSTRTSSTTTKTTSSSGQSRSSFSKLLKDGSISVNTRTNLAGFNRASRQNAELYPFVLEGMTRVKDTFLQQGFSTEDLVYNSVFYRIENGKLFIIY